MVGPSGDRIPSLLGVFVSRRIDTKSPVCTSFTRDRL